MSAKACFVLAASVVVQAFAGANLIRNGTFEGTATASAWGAYANAGASKFQCDGWGFPVPAKAGLGTPNGTWMSSGLAVGSYALFIQTGSGSGEVIVKQAEDIALTAGVYRVSLQYTTRPGTYTKNPRPTTYVELVDSEGRVFSAGGLSTTATSLQSFSKDMLLPSDTYTFRLRQPQTSEDRANVIEGVSLVRLDDDLAGAMRAAASGDVLIFDTDGAGNATLSGGTLAWNGNMPMANVPGTLTISGANAIAAYASAPGTYTLFTAGAIVTESGASLALDAPAVTDGLVRTLTVGANTVTLEVALDPARAEMVIDGDFDIPGVSSGAMRSETWGDYTYRRGGFAMPWWQYDTCPQGTLGDSGCGLGKGDGVWLAAGQTNGGVYSYFMQTGKLGTGGFKNPKPLIQDFGATPAGIYRFKFNYAARPSLTGLNVVGTVRKDGEGVHIAMTAPTTNTKLSEFSQIVALPSAGNYGVAFDVRFKENADRGADLDDVSFLRTTVAGWSIAGGVAVLSGTANVPARSFVDGNAEIASGATLTMEGDNYAPGLTVAGALTVKGPVTITLPSAYGTQEGVYTLLKADTLVYNEGASFVLDSASATVDNETYVHHAVLELAGNEVILRMFHYTPTSNNYRKSAAECVDTLWQTDGNWSRDHMPTNGDGAVIFNHSGTVLFDAAYANEASLKYYFRNGLQAPVVFDATDDAYGFDFKGDYLFRGAGAGHNGFAGWTEFRRGTYSGVYFCVNDTSQGAKNSKFRIDFTGAAVNLSQCLQCGYSDGSESEVNISAGTVRIDYDYNTTIQPNTRNRTRVTGGSLYIGRNLQATAAVGAQCDIEVTGGEMTVIDTMNVAYDKLGSHGVMRLSGGVVRANAISAPAGYGVFLFNGGALAPNAASTSWLDGSLLTVALGKSAIVDTEGKDVTWSPTVVDASGGVAYDFTKRGAGTLTFSGDQAFTGTLAVEGGTLFAPVALAASRVEVADGGTYSVADGTEGQAFALATFAPAGGGRIAIDLSATACDSFTATSLDLSGASAANPVVLMVNPVGIAELADDANYTLITSGLAAGDAAKFAVAGVDGLLSVVNGALVLKSSSRAKVTAEWSGAANDGGKWTTGGNWTGGEAPQNGDTAAFNLAAGGTTDFDIGGLALGGLVFGENAGAFTHGGAENLRVTGAISNLSANAQTFTVPVTLGVSGQSMEINTAGDLVLTGATTTAAGTLTKKGAGTFSVPDAAVLTAARIEVDEGTLRIDERVGSLDAPVEGEIVVKDGARLDLNIDQTVVDIPKNEPTRSKTIRIAGTGPDGAGALYNSVPSTAGSSQISDLVLTGDAKVGGANVTVRGGVTGSVRPDASLTGPYTLTVANTAVNNCDLFYLVNAALDVGGINVTGGLLLQGALAGTAANGVRFADGSLGMICGATLAEGIPLAVEPSAAVALNIREGDSIVNGPFTIGAGATVTATMDSEVRFNGAVTNAGTFAQTKGNVFFDGTSLVGGAYVAGGNHVWFGGAIDSPESEITISGGTATTGIFIFGAQSTLPGTGLPNFKAINVDGAFSEARFMPRASCEITNSLYDAVVANAGSVWIDSVENADAVLTLKNANWSTKGELRLGSNNGRGAYLKIGEGATLTVAAGLGLYFASGIASPMENILEVAEGGTLNYLGANNYFQIGRGGAANDANALPQRLAITGGTVNMPDAQLLIGAYARTAYADLSAGLLAVNQLQLRQTVSYIANWGNAYDVRFTQTGGVLELGSGGSMSAIPGANKPCLDLANGTLRAMADLSNRYGYMNIQFGASPARTDGKYEIDLNGKTVNWNAPLLGMSEVTVSGEGKFNSAAALQSIPLGKWIVTNTTQIADLSGAAGFACGLTVAPGASAKLAVAGEGLVEWTMFTSAQMANFDALKAYTGVCPYVGTTLGHIHLSYASGSKIVTDNTRFIYRGQFKVDADKAGKWHFAVNYDDNVGLFIDGSEVASSTSYNAVGTGSAELAEGWHDFRVLVLDGSGSCGPYVSDWKTAGMGVGWTTDDAAAGSKAASFYKKFDTSTLAMRLPQGAAAQSAVRVRVHPGNCADDVYASDKIGYPTFDCVTNSLALLHTFAGDSVASFANSSVVRFDGSFRVPVENAGEWTFWGYFDDRIHLEIDGVKVLHATSTGYNMNAKATLTAGWHSFRISTTDGVGSYGGKLTDDNGKVCALKAKPANSTKTLAFDGENFRIVYSASDAQKMCAAGLGGVTELGVGSVLFNRDGVPQGGACPIYGTLTGSGALDGCFRFVGTNSAIRVKGSAGRLVVKPDLDDVVNGDCLAALARVEADFSGGKPTAAKYNVCAAGALDSAAAKAIKVEVTLPEGETADDWTATVVQGRLVIVNPHPGGCVIYMR